jgi:hypothetical protein
MVDESNGRKRRQRANDSGEGHQAQIMIVYDAVINSKHFVHHSNLRLSGTEKNLSDFEFHGINACLECGGKRSAN